MREKQNKTFWSVIYSSNIFLAILLVVLVLSILKVGKELARRHQINKEIEHLNQQLSEAELNKNKLEDLISYLQSDQYIEEQARTQLNLSKPGEKRIDLSEQPKTLAQSNNNTSNLSNQKKWFAYFFK